MKVTKFVHSCVVIDAEDAGARRVALFDPGAWSTVPVEQLDQLDDIFISHIHPDHCDIELVKALAQRFSRVRITGPTEVVTHLHQQGVRQAADVMPANSQAFVAPHEPIAPFGGAAPQEIGVHYLNAYTHPGDSHSFHETRSILALPVVAPWGSTRRAVELALELKPQYVLPIHDWFLSTEARVWTYEMMARVLSEQGIVFLKPETGIPLEINIEPYN